MQISDSLIRTDAYEGYSVIPHSGTREILHKGTAQITDNDKISTPRQCYDSGAPCMAPDTR